MIIFFPRDRITREAGSWIVLEPRMPSKVRTLDQVRSASGSFGLVLVMEVLADDFGAYERHDGRADAW